MESFVSVTNLPDADEPKLASAVLLPNGNGNRETAQRAARSILPAPWLSLDRDTLRLSWSNQSVLGGGFIRAAQVCPTRGFGLLGSMALESPVDRRVADFHSEFVNEETSKVVQSCRRIGLYRLPQSAQHGQVYFPFLPSSMRHWFDSARLAKLPY